MNIDRYLKKISVIFISVVVTLLAISDVRAQTVDPHLELLPSSSSITESGTSVDVMIDTGGQDAKSSKAVITYDPDLIEISSIVPGSFFDEVSYNIYNDTGEVIINASLSLGSALETKNGVGVLAILTAVSKRSSGEATIVFDCSDGSSTDSGINSPAQLDIIVCSANLNGTYSLSGGSDDSSDDDNGGDSDYNSDDSEYGTGTGGGDPYNDQANVLPAAGSPNMTIFITSLGFSLVFLSIPVFRKAKMVS